MHRLLDEVKCGANKEGTCEEACTGDGLPEGDAKCKVSNEQLKCCGLRLFSRSRRRSVTLSSSATVVAALSSLPSTELRRSGIRDFRDRAPDCPEVPEVAPGELGQRGNYRFLTEFLRMPLDNGLWYPYLRLRPPAGRWGERRERRRGQARGALGVRNSGQSAGLHYERERLRFR